MAIYHLSVKTISRKSGKSVVASASYRANEKLFDERLQRNFRFRNKEEVIHSEILAPANADEKFQNRSKLWNEVEKFERRKDARLAREIEFALPDSANFKESLQLARNFLNENFVKNGYVVDFSFHKKDGNPHIHALISERKLEPGGKSFAAKKDREMNKKEKVFEWRKSWEVIENKFLDSKNLEKVSCLSYRELGINKIPTVHVGIGKTRNERKKLNESIRLANSVVQLDDEIAKLKEQKAALTASDHAAHEPEQPAFSAASVVSQSAGTVQTTAPVPAANSTAQPQPEADERLMQGFRSCYDRQMKFSTPKKADGVTLRVLKKQGYSEQESNQICAAFNNFLDNVKSEAKKQKMSLQQFKNEKLPPVSDEETRMDGSPKEKLTLFEFTEGVKKFMKALGEGFAGGKSQGKALTK